MEEHTRTSRSDGTVQTILSNLPEGQGHSNCFDCDCAATTTTTTTTATTTSQSLTPTLTTALHEPSSQSQLSTNTSTATTSNTNTNSTNTNTNTLQNEQEQEQEMNDSSPMHQSPTSVQHPPLRCAQHIPPQEHETTHEDDDALVPRNSKTNYEYEYEYEYESSTSPSQRNLNPSRSPCESGKFPTSTIAFEDNDIDIGFDFESASECSVADYNDLPVLDPCDYHDTCCKWDDDDLADDHDDDGNDEDDHKDEEDSSTCSSSFFSDHEHDHDDDCQNHENFTDEDHENQNLQRSVDYNDYFYHHSHCVVHPDTTTIEAATSSLSITADAGTDAGGADCGGGTIATRTSTKTTLVNHHHHDPQEPRKRTVQFSSCLVTEVRTRPFTTPQEWHQFFYSAHELQRMMDEVEDMDHHGVGVAEPMEGEERGKGKGTSIPIPVSIPIQNKRFITASEDELDFDL